MLIIFVFFSPLFYWTSNYPRLIVVRCLALMDVQLCCITSITCWSELMGDQDNWMLSIIRLWASLNVQHHRMFHILGWPTLLDVDHFWMITITGCYSALLRFNVIRWMFSVLLDYQHYCMIGITEFTELLDVKLHCMFSIMGFSVIVKQYVMLT